MEGLFSSATYLLRWKQWLQWSLDRTVHQLREAQDNFTRDFNKRARVLVQQVRTQPLRFVRKEYYGRNESNHKLASIAEGPFEAVSANADTGEIQDGDRQESILRDCAVDVPSPTAALRKKTSTKHGEEKTKIKNRRRLTKV